MYKLRGHDALQGLGLVVRSDVNSKLRSRFSGRLGFLCLLVGAAQQNFQILPRGLTNI